MTCRGKTLGEPPPTRKGQERVRKGSGKGQERVRKIWVRSGLDLGKLLRNPRSILIENRVLIFYRNHFFIEMEFSKFELINQISNKLKKNSYEKHDWIYSKFPYSFIVFQRIT